MQLSCVSVVHSCFSPLQEDVGGATLMCIGSSAPDIFSGIIAILFVEGDLGVGTVMGTTVFNLLLVVGLMGMAICNDSFTLMWWPTSRFVLSLSYSKQSRTRIETIVDNAEQEIQKSS